MVRIACLKYLHQVDVLLLQVLDDHLTLKHRVERIEQLECGVNGRAVIESLSISSKCCWWVSKLTTWPCSEQQGASSRRAGSSNQRAASSEQQEGKLSNVDQQPRGHVAALPSRPPTSNQQPASIE